MIPVQKKKFYKEFNRIQLLDIVKIKNKVLQRNQHQIIINTDSFNITMIKA